MYYGVWQQFCPTAQEEYKEFEWFLVFLRRQGGGVGQIVSEFLSSLESKNMDARTYCLMHQIHGWHNIDLPDQYFWSAEVSEVEESNDDNVLGREEQNGDDESLLE